MTYTTDQYGEVSYDYNSEGGVEFSAPKGFSLSEATQSALQENIEARFADMTGDEDLDDQQQNAQQILQRAQAMREEAEQLAEEARQADARREEKLRRREKKLRQMAQQLEEQAQAQEHPQPQPRRRGQTARQRAQAASSGGTLGAVVGNSTVQMAVVGLVVVGVLYSLARRYVL